LGVLAMYEFVINSDRKTISQRLLTFFIWFEVHIQPFLRSKILQISDPSISQCVDYSFKLTKKFNYYTLGSLNKPTIPGNGIFSLTVPHSAECLYCVPKSNPANKLILLYI